MINSLVPGRVNIGRIDLLPAYSLFDVEKGAAKKVVGALKGNEFYGHRIYAEIATDKDYAAKGRKKGGKEREGDGRRKGEKRYGSPRKGSADSRYKHERRSSNPRKERRK